MHRFQRGGRGGGPRPGPNPNGPGAPGKEWNFGLTSYANGVATPVPLVSARADAKVLNYGAEVSFTQTYRNTGATALDATYDVPAQLTSHSSYVFPIPFQGTVTGVEASIDGVTIISHVRDRQSAPKERPEDASNLPVIMYVTEQDRLYLQLKAVLPNIPAGKNVQFKITYVTEIAMDDDRLRLTVPLKFTTTKRPPKPEAGAPAPAPERDQAHLDLHIALDMPDIINAVETNGASIFHLSGQPHQAAVSLAPKNFVPYDFSVFTRLANPRNNRVTIETHTNGARLAILDFFVPGLQNYQPDGAKAKDEGKEKEKEKEKEKDEKESTSPAPVTAAEPAKEDIAASPAVPKAAPAAAPAKHTKKRFSASDLSIESSDKSLLFVALPVAPAVTRGRVTLFVPLPADFAGATINVGPKDAPGLVQLQIDSNTRVVDSTVGHRLYARAFIRELESELEQRPAEARAEELRKSVIAISTRFGVASNFTQFITYEKVGDEEKEIAPLARKRQPQVKPLKEPAAAVPAAASGSQPNTPEVERKSDGNVVGEKKERPQKREKPAAKPGAKPVDGAAAPAPVPATPVKPAAAVAEAAHGHGQQQAGQRHNQPGRQQPQQQRPPRDVPKTQELEATTLFRSISRMQNNWGAWNINRNFADVICIDINDVQGAIRTHTTPGIGRVWATVLAISFIELGGFEKDPSERNAVRDVLQRARKWLSDTVPGKEAEWLEKAKAFIGDHIELVDA